MSKSVLRGPQLTGEMYTHGSQNKMEKVRITDFHPQSLKQKQGWRLQLLGKWRDIQKMWSQKERKTEIENRIPKHWLLLINMREVKAPLTRRNDLHR